MLSQFSSEQWGMVTATQASRADVSPVDLSRLVSDGILEPVPDAARVYRFTTGPEDLELDSLRAAWLQLGGSRTTEERLREPDAVVSHRSAAHALDLGDLIPRRHELLVTSRRQPRRQDLRLRIRSRLGSWALTGGLPVSTATATITDLLDDDEDESAVARICQDALRRGLITESELVEMATPHVPRYGAPSAPAMATALAGALTGR